MWSWSRDGQRARWEVSDEGLCPQGRGGIPGHRLPMHEARQIVSSRNRDLHLVVCSVGLIDVLETLAQSTNCDPDDRVGLRVEVLTPGEGFDGDRMLADLVGFIVEILVADELQDSGVVIRAAYDAGTQQPFELFTLKIELCIDGDHQATSLTLLETISYGTWRIANILNPSVIRPDSRIAHRHSQDSVENLHDTQNLQCLG